MPVSAPTRHHDLCFGCGLANLFGLQLETGTAPDGGLTGRFFVKQDHQDAQGFAHPGVIAAALAEAMSHAAGGDGAAHTSRLELELEAPAAVGSFATVEARIERREAEGQWVVAVAHDEDGQRLALARALLTDED